MRTEQEFARLAQGHQGHHRVQDLAGYPIPVPSHAVSAVSVEVDPHGVEVNAIAHGECRSGVLEPLVRNDFLLIEFLPGRQPRFVDLAVVHPTTTLAPGHVTKELLKSEVRAGDPALAVVHPGVCVQGSSFEAREGRIHTRALVCPQRGLPCGNRECGGAAHHPSCTRSGRFPERGSPAAATAGGTLSVCGQPMMRSSSYTAVPQPRPFGLISCRCPIPSTSRERASSPRLVARV